MNWFFISPFSINVLNVSLLLAFMIYFLIRIENKSKATKFLIFFLSGVVLVFISFFVIFSSLNAYYTTLFWWILHLVVFSTIAMVQFAYHFPENLHPRESKVALLVCVILSAVVYPYYILKSLSMEPVYFFEGYSYVFLHIPHIGITIGLEILWIIALFFRKGVAFSEYEYRGSLSRWSRDPGRLLTAKGVAGIFPRFLISFIKIFKAKDKRAKAIRNLFLLFFFPIILILSIVMSYEGFIPWEISAHILGAGFMVVAFIFVIVYINASAEPSTFMIKLIGISLGTTLIVLGLASNVVLLAKDDEYEKRRLAEVDQCKKAVLVNDLSALPEKVIYILARSLKKDFRNSEYIIVFSKYPTSRLGLRVDDNDRFAKDGGNGKENFEKGLLLRRYRKVNDKEETFFYIHYDFILNNELYEIGFEYVDYRREIHSTGVKFVLITLGSVVFITIVFPFFFKESLVKPLTGLLDGVKKVNTGDLEVNVQVKVEDEIGFISKSFNNMVRSIKSAKQEIESALDYQVKLTDSYSCFVPKEFLEFLGKESIIDIRLGDHVQKEMTILFSDIRSFTELSERMRPQENFNFINSCLNRIGPIVRQNQGFIDKYIGDAIMALFPRNSEDAVKAAIAMQTAVGIYNQHRMNYRYDPIRIGIGINTGLMMLGTIGEEKRMEGTVISDAVNLASRVENLTKVYGSFIIVTDKTLENIQNPDDFNYRYLDRVQVKGKQKWVDIFEILDSESRKQQEMKLETRQLFEQGISLYQSKEFNKALDCFASVLDTNEADEAAKLYVKRCRYFERHGTPEGWEGVTEMYEK
jgi:class 3 adenylate cyclase/HAMP domain-containing protein